MRYFTNVFSRLNRRSRRLLVIAAITVVPLSIIVFASIPDSNGVFHGCYKKVSGTLRVIDDATIQCDSNEAPIQWSQTGPQGPQGLTGPQGPAGPGGAKAMAYVDANGTIIRCYNGVTGSTTGGCGFTVGRPPGLSTGTYSIDFGFDISHSFFSLTVNSSLFDSVGMSVDFVRGTGQEPSSSQLWYQVTADNAGFYDRPVMVLVF